MKHITDFTIIERRQIGEQYFTLKLRHPEQLPAIAAGQFVEVEVEGNRQVMLRRPISIHDVDPTNNTLTLLIQTVGKGTRQLAKLKEGDKLNLIYPLGHGFPIPNEGGKKALLVGGGAGIAPLYHLARCLSAKGLETVILLGGRTESLIPIKDQFAEFGQVLYTTDDGSLGEKGMVIQHSRFADHYDVIYTCGPTPMMKAIARHALENNIECYVSLENMMACGIGACLCCVCDTDKGHKCVCKEGPVFNAQELTKWIG